MEELKKIYRRSLWESAAVLGLMMGLPHIICYIFDIFKGDSLFTLVNVFFPIGGAVFCQIFYGRRLAGCYPSEQGFTYSRSYGFMILMALIAGIVPGLMQYIIMKVDVQYAEHLLGLATDAIEGMVGISDLQKEKAVEMLPIMMSLPVLLISGVINLLLTGGITGLFTSIVVKRAPDLGNQ